MENLVHRTRLILQKSFNKLQKRQCSSLLQHSSDADNSHEPVLGNKVVELLNPLDGQVFLDMTFGNGGHTKKLLDTGKQILVFTMDRDPNSYLRSVQLSKQYPNQIIPMLGRFSDIPKLFAEHNLKKNTINGLILDVGVSNLQWNDNERGFRPNSPGFLDMRMDKDRLPNSMTAYDVINTLDANSLSLVFRLLGQEKLAKKYADLLVDSRHMLKYVKTSQELSYLIASIHSDKGSPDEIASQISNRIFYALRVFVNNELNELDYAIKKMHPFLKQDNLLVEDRHQSLKISQEQIENYSAGKAIVISYTSVEDALVKEHFNEYNENADQLKLRGKSSLDMKMQDESLKVFNKNWVPINKHIITADEHEILINDFARTAKLRAVMRI